MNIRHDYYELTNTDNVYPSWVKSENYFNCDSFSKFFSIFKRFYN